MGAAAPTAPTLTMTLSSDTPDLVKLLAVMGLIDHRQTATHFLTIYALDYLSYLMVPMLKKEENECVEN